MFNKGNMSKMLKQAQAMQSKMADVQEQLNEVVIEETYEDLITVKVNGKMDLLDVNISDDAMKEDKDVLEDLLVSTLNKALKKAQDEAQSRMNAVTGNLMDGLKIPGM